MSGLSYLSDGSSTTPESEQPSDVSISTAPLTNKSAYQLPKPTGNVQAGAGTLAAMEELYQQMLARQTGLSGFLEAAKDAQAWWTGDSGERSRALSRRTQERAQQQADLFNVRSQIAQFKAAQESAQKQATSLKGLAGGVEPGAPTAAGEEGVSQVPANVRAEMSRLLGLGDIAGANAAYNNWFKTDTNETIKFLNNAASYKADVEIIRPDTGQYDVVSAIEAKRLFQQGKARPTGKTVGAAAPAAAAPAAAAPAAAAPAAAAPAAGITTKDIATVESGNRPEAVSPKGARGIMQVMPNTLKDPGFGVRPAQNDSPEELQRVGEDYFNALLKRYNNNDMLAAIAYNMGPGATDKWLDSGAGVDKLPQETRDYVTKIANLMAQRGEKPTGQVPGAQPVQVAAAPAETRTDVTAPTAPAAKPRETIPDARIRLKAEEAAQTGEINIINKEYEGFRADVKSAPLKESTASEAITLLEKDPQVVALLQEPGIAPALATLFKTGISAPGGHSIGVKEIEEVLFRGRKDLSKEEIRVRDRLRTLFDTNSLFAAGIMKNQGQITEFERKLLERMVGSLESTPENLIKIQKVLQARAKLDMELGEKFDRSGLTYNRFIKTPEYRNAVVNYQRQIKDIESQDVRIGIGSAPAAGTTSSGVKWKVQR